MYNEILTASLSVATLLILYLIKLIFKKMKDNKLLNILGELPYFIINAEKNYKNGGEKLNYVISCIKNKYKINEDILKNYINIYVDYFKKFGDIKNDIKKS